MEVTPMEMEKFKSGKQKKILNKIKEIRWERELTDDYLAEKSGLTKQAINKIENGESDLRHTSMLRICKALEMNATDVFELDWRNVDL
jgi:DNA-binding XRE family transcriptional regulator